MLRKANNLQFEYVFDISRLASVVVNADEVAIAAMEVRRRRRGPSFGNKDRSSDSLSSGKSVF